MLDFKKIASGDDLMRAIARDVVWDIKYHERELRLAYKGLAFAKTLLDRLDLIPQIDLEKARELYAERGEDINEAYTLDEYIAMIAGSAFDGVRYHEQALLEATDKLAALKALLIRTKYTVDFRAIEQEVEKQLASPS
jgi:hypothetical protein